MPTKKNHIELTVNGATHKIDVEARWSLVDVLRDTLRLTGTHIGCEHGVCGACTVLIDGEPIRSCLMFAVQADGRDIRTVEGLAIDGNFNVMQQAFHDHHALQCGFCTPGMLMLATWIVEQKKPGDDKELKELVASNLCRCTGYQNIIKAIRSVIDGEKE